MPGRVLMKQQQKTAGYFAAVTGQSFLIFALFGSSAVVKRHQGGDRHPGLYEVFEYGGLASPLGRHHLHWGQSVRPEPDR
jgi:hypothetical protein